MKNNIMGGFGIEFKEEAAGKQDNGDSRSHSHVQVHHGRSKSAADRDLDISRPAVLHALKDKQNDLQASPPSARVDRAPSPHRENPSYVNKSTSFNQRASLEKDIELLQSHLQQEKAVRMMLEKAMGRVSSTLSPGHRHFASKTNELIAEIELLEEEVANREQHVLSLYRSIFEHCVSRTCSEQSSTMASPAHTKHASKKHPSIISSAFCSSKKFHLRPLQTLVSVNDHQRNSSKTSDDTLQFFGKSDVQFEKISSNPIKVPTVEKTSVLRTLKEHLYKCPSKLSEEMVRCMAAVYCWVSGAASAYPKRNRSPSLSKASNNVVLAQRGVPEGCDWPCKSTIEISWISTDKSRLSRASCGINKYRVLVEQLERVTLSQMENSIQLAFWINVYNALVMHAYLAFGIPHNALRRLALFHKAAYNIGGHVVSANAIEQSIFRFHTPRTGRWLESILSTALRKKSGDDKQLITSKFGLSHSEPIACFALCTGAFSGPMLKVYTASNVKEELELAKREFLQANVVVKKSRKLFLPKVLERFAREATISIDDLLKWVIGNVDKKLQDSIQKCIDGKSFRKASQIIEWSPFSTKFRYVFSKDLVEKPLRP